MLALDFAIANSALDEADSGRVRDSTTNGASDLLSARRVQAGGYVECEFLNPHNAVWC